VDYGVELGAAVNENNSHIGINFVQVGEGSVECNRDFIISESVGTVYKLEWVHGI
jgi:hypothetical protein